jgi:single-strand DNA-binding protein
MSLDLNVVVFGGRLTDDPTNLGGKGCKIEVACNRSYKSGEDTKRETTFMPVFCWGKLGEQVSRSCKKGDSVVVEGELEDRRFTGDDGQKKKVVGIRAKDVRFVSVKVVEMPEEPKKFDNNVPAESKDALRNLLGK